MHKISKEIITNIITKGNSSPPSSYSSASSYDIPGGFIQPGYKRQHTNPFTVTPLLHPSNTLSNTSNSPLLHPIHPLLPTTTSTTTSNPQLLPTTTSTTTSPTTSNTPNPSTCITPMHDSTMTYSAALAPQPSPQKVTQIIRLKIIPPFRREHTENRDTLEHAVHNCIGTIVQNFEPKYRPFLTISRTFTHVKARRLHTLLVTAPAEAEENVLRLQTTGITMLNRTIFPTTDEIWRFSPSMYPKKVTLRISNLPALCTDGELKEMINFPPETQTSELARTTINTDFGPIYNGDAYATVLLYSEEEEKRLTEWSFKQKLLETPPEWHGIPVYCHIPRLHQCRICHEEGRKTVIGHDAAWCRNQRPKIPTIEDEEEQDEGDQPKQVEENWADASPNPCDPNKSTVPNEHEPQWETTKGKTINKRKSVSQEDLQPTPGENKFMALGVSPTKSRPTNSPRSKHLHKTSNSVNDND